MIHIQDFGLVSIITPNYNCKRFIAETIESVLSQSYQNWEMLIQDDCSNDGSYELALEYEKRDPRIKVQRNSKNSGAAVTRNNAIERSQGEWLAFLDSDDLWYPDKLERQLRWMNDNKTDFSFTEYELIDENNNPLNLIANVTDKLTYRKLMRVGWPGCLTVMYRQDTANKVYGPDISKNNDTALFLKVLKHTEGRGIPLILAKYRIRKGSISRNKLKVIKPYVRVINEFEGQSIFFAYYCVISHALYKIFRKYRRK